MSRYIYNEKLKHRRGKSQLREASEHNLASFRARGNKWLDPGKDSLTDEMLNFIYSHQRKVACREIRSLSLSRRTGPGSNGTYCLERNFTKSTSTTPFNTTVCSTHGITSPMAA